MPSYIEIIGYVASAIILFSMLFKNILKLRILNFIGSIMFTVYGLIAGLYPVILLNACSSLINLYHIIFIHTRKNYFSTLRVPDGNFLFFNKFLLYHGKDIRKHFPDFQLSSLKAPNILFILRNLLPVGLFIYETNSNGEVSIKLDYVIPEYRDLKNTPFVLEHERDNLIDQGFQTFVAENVNPIHQKYLLKIGFIRDKINPNLFRKNFF